MSISIRRATTTDLESVAPLFELYRQFYKHAPDLEGSRAFMRDRLARGDSTIFLALNGSGAAVGFAQLYPSFASVSVRPLFILNDLYVAEEARKCGVGSLLLRAARDCALAAGAARLMLRTARDNHVAQKLYRDQGWQEETRFLGFEYPLA